MKLKMLFASMFVSTMLVGCGGATDSTTDPTTTDPTTTDPTTTDPTTTDPTTVSKVTVKNAVLLDGFTTQDVNAKQLEETGFYYFYYFNDYNDATQKYDLVRAEYDKWQIVGNRLIFPEVGMYGQDVDENPVSGWYENLQNNKPVLQGFDGLIYKPSLGKWSTVKSTDERVVDDLPDLGSQTFINYSNRGAFYDVVNQAIELDGRQISSVLNSFENNGIPTDIEDSAIFGTAAFSAGAIAYNMTEVNAERTMQIRSNRTVSWGNSVNGVEVNYSSLNEALLKGAYSTNGFVDAGIVYAGMGLNIIVGSGGLSNEYSCYIDDYQEGKTSGSCTVKKWDDATNSEIPVQSPAFEWKIENVGGKQVLLTSPTDTSLQVDFNIVIEHDGAIYYDNFATEGFESQFITFNKQAVMDLKNAFDPTLIGLAARSVQQGKKPKVPVTSSRFHRSTNNNKAIAK